MSKSKQSNQPQKCPHLARISNNNTQANQPKESKQCPHSSRLQRLTGHIKPMTGPVKTTTGEHVREFKDMPTPAVFDEDAYRNRTHEYISELHNALGDIIRIPVEGKQQVFVRHPATIRRVLKSEVDFPKSFADADANSTGFLQHFKNLVQPLLSQAQVFGSGDNSARRAKLKKVFLSSKAYLPGFVRACDSVDSWPDTSDRFNVVDKLHRVVFDQVMVIMAGEHDATGCDELFDACQASLVHFVGRYSFPSFDESISSSDEAVMEGVMNAGLQVTSALRERAGQGPLDPAIAASLLGFLVDSEFSSEELTATMINALFAACEAPIHVLCMLLVELSQNPELQDALYAELQANPDPMRSDLMSAYVMEALRLFAPVTLVQRSTPAGLDSVIDGYKVPPLTPLLVCVTAVHQNPAIFPKPRVYDPTRKSMNLVMLKEDNLFLTFGGGPRGCPGRHLAFTILRNSVAIILKKFRLVPASNDFSRRIHKFVEFPIGGAFVGLERRNAQE